MAGVVAALIAAALPAESAPPAPTALPDDGARAFYAKVLALRVRGVPDRSQQRKLAPTISSRLASALRAAGDAEQRHRRTTRNDEPPLWQGDLFTSLFEGPTEAAVERCQAEGDHAQCIVSLAYKDHFGGAHRWHDRAVLVRERGRWVVDDVGYGATWAFGNKGTLRENLKAGIAQAPPPEAKKASGAGRSSRARGR